MRNKNINCLHIIIASTIIIIPALSGFSDDAPINIVSGGATLISIENDDIKMESETVEIVLYPHTHYSVDATFEFFNYGKNVTLEVGFPYYSLPWYDTAEEYFKSLEFHTFHTYVNGEECDIKDIPGEMFVNKLVNFEHPNEYVCIKDPNEIEKIREKLRNNKLSLDYVLKEKRWLVKKVTFKANTKTITRIYYEAPYIHYSAGCIVEYIYGTGKSWKSTIGNAQFIIKNTLGHIELNNHNIFDDSYYKMLYEEPGDDIHIERTYTKNKISEFICEYILTDFEPLAEEAFHYDGCMSLETDLYFSENDEELFFISKNMQNEWPFSSSTYPEDKWGKYSPQMAFDGDESTAWVEGYESEGLGERIAFIIPNKSKKIKILPGYGKKNIFKKNNRVKKAKLTIYFINLEIDSKPYGTRHLIYNYKKIKTFSLYFKDILKIQEFTLGVDTNPQKPFNSVLGVLTIEDVYYGKDMDTCIGEIQFDK